MVRDTKSSKRTSKKLPDRARARRKTRLHGSKPTIDDVYEYAPSKVRRAKVALSLDRHEADGRPHESDDEMDLSGLSTEAMKKLRARLMRDDDDDDDEGGGGGVDTEDDEDIDSEDAFEENDRDEFAGSEFVRKGAARKSDRREKEAEVDLNEDEADETRPVSENEDEDEEDEDAGEFIDVLDVFDGRADAKNGEVPLPNAVEKIPTRTTTEEDEEEGKGTRDTDVSTSGDDEEDSDDDDDNDDDDELQISASDAEDPSPSALADLESFLSNLDPTVPHKRKPDAAAELDPKKRRRLTDRTEAGEESEFGVRGSSTLQLDDLLAPLASSSSLAALKKSTKLLTSSSAKTKTLAAPLPRRAQERLDREAAYEQTKEEVDKWSATMKRIKEAEHLSFPLQAEKPARVSNLELAAKFTPSNELESAVDKLLKSAQLQDQDIEQTESLKMAHLTVEEVAARRAELRAMRELAFRADRKAKRIAKIKSKTYRRIRKKQRERLDGPGGNAEGQQGDEDGDGEAQLEAEVQRARERATLRHANAGKWAKAMKGREGLDQDQRQAIGEMLERGEKLRRRIRGEDSGDEKSEDESESADEGRDEDAIKHDAFEELAALRADANANADADLSDPKHKSVFNMKFMQDAAARRAREADAQAEELQKELGFGIGEGEEEEEEDNFVPGPTDETATVQRTGGRLSFRPGTTPGALKSLGSLASDTSSVTLQSTDLLPDMSANEQTQTPSPSISAPTPTINPWLVPPPSSFSGPTRKRNDVRVHKDADALTKSSNKLRKQAAKDDEERERAKDDATLEIDTNRVLTIPEPPVPGVLNEKRKERKARRGANASPARDRNDDDNDGESDAASEVEAQEHTMEEKKGAKGLRAFEQRDLVALAFAGDNVVQAFEEAKRQETEADAPREVDTTLPGWGAWGGTGTKKLPPKPRLIKTLPGIAPTARTDHAKPHLIVSEKRDRKASKYLVRELPHPYTSHAQYERRMDVPLGCEWNTRVGFQRGTLPRVVKKMGTVIDPLEKLF